MEPALDIDIRAADLADAIRDDDTWLLAQNSGCRSSRLAALRLIWRRHVVSGNVTLGDFVETTLDRFCCLSVKERRHLRPADDQSQLVDAVRALELFTWVWRERRSANLGAYAVDVANWAAEAIAVSSMSSGASDDDHRASLFRQAMVTEATGLTLVALLEAGSVFGRREWLAASMKHLDVIIARAGQGDIADAGVARLDGVAAMCRAALACFDAFGKVRYLDQAQHWVEMLDDGFWSATAGCFHDRRLSAPTGPDPHSGGNVLMLGVLARLGEATSNVGFRAQAERLATAIRHRNADIDPMALSALDALETPVTIRVSGDPHVAETRSLMQLALNYSLPDRRVLGPGAGGAAADRLPAAAHVSVGMTRFAPMDEVALRKFCAPGGIGSMPA